MTPSLCHQAMRICDCGAIPPSPRSRLARRIRFPWAHWATNGIKMSITVFVPLAFSNCHPPRWTFRDFTCSTMALHTEEAPRPIVLLCIGRGAAQRYKGQEERRGLGEETAGTQKGE